MCYTKRDRDLEKETRTLTESNLMEEETRLRHEEHHRRRRRRAHEEEEKKPLTEKVKEVVGVR
jgi:hypothetical protein